MTPHTRVVKKVWFVTRIAYAGILNRPVEIHSVRASTPGVGDLRRQHTVAILTMTELASAEVVGNLPANRKMTFTPTCQVQG